MRRGARSNYDHIAAAGAVYVLNSKNIKDSSLAIEDDKLRVTHIDSGDGYIADRWLPQALGEARSLKLELAERLGFPVHVYPVLVIWGQFDSEQRYVGEVSVVRGDKIGEWLRSRPSDLPTREKREALAQAVNALPHA